MNDAQDITGVTGSAKIGDVLSLPTGLNLDDSIEAAKRYAAHTQQIVLFRFNDIWLTVTASTSVVSMKREYMRQHGRE